MKQIKSSVKEKFSQGIIPSSHRLLHALSLGGSAVHVLQLAKVNVIVPFVLHPTGCSAMYWTFHVLRLAKVNVVAPVCPSAFCIA